MPRYRTAQFLNAAGRCFQRYGLFRTRMEGIAAEVPCSKVTLYKHYPDKTHLASAWLTDRMTRSRERVAAILGSDRPFDDKVKRLVAQKQADLGQLGDRFTRDLFSPDCPAGLRRTLQRQAELNKQQTVWMIDLGRAEGAIDPAIGEDLIRLLLDHFERLFTDPAFAEHVPENRRIDTLVGLFLYGVQRHPVWEIHR